MTVTNIFANNTPLDITKVNENFEDVFKYLDGDQTIATTTSTSEVEIGEVTIPANTVNNGIFVIATGKGLTFQNTTDDAGPTIRLRAGENATATSNTQYKEITRIPPDLNTYTAAMVGWTIIYYIDNLTWANINYVHITGFSNGPSTNTRSASCESIEVLYL